MFIRVADYSTPPKTCGMKFHQMGQAALKGGFNFASKFLRRDSTKVVIQEIPTGRYWDSKGIWTSDFENATAFLSCYAALEQMDRYRLSNVQLILARELKEYQIIPLKPRTNTPPSDSVRHRENGALRGTIGEGGLRVWQLQAS